MGTRPYTLKISVTLLLTPSSKASIAIPPPIVIQRKSSDGGYLLILINDRNENILPLECSVQGIGSPYSLMNLSKINNNMRPPPSCNSSFFLHAGLTSGRNSLPKQYPSNITPVQGRNAYTI